MADNHRYYATWSNSDHNKWQNENTLSSYLQRFGQHWALPSEEVLRETRRVTDRLLRILQSHSDFAIDSNIPCGSYQKKTFTSLKVDLDFVVYVRHKDWKTNNKELYNRILNHWKSLLAEHTELREEDLDIGKAALTFYLEGIEIDLLPAPIFCQNWKENCQVLYEEISGHNNWYKYAISAGLTQVGIDFIKRQSSMVHDLCRLTKIWQQGVFFQGNTKNEGYISGRSFIFECLSVYAARESAKDCMYDYLECFFLIVNDLRNRSIYFPECYGEFGIEVTGRDKGLWMPHNPTVNLLQGQPADFFDTFARKADASLKALHEARNGPPPGDDCLLYILKPGGLKPVSSDEMEGVVAWYDPNCRELMPAIKKRQGCSTKTRPFKKFLNHYASFGAVWFSVYESQEVILNEFEQNGIKVHKAGLGTEKDMTFVLPCFRRERSTGSIYITFESESEISAGGMTATAIGVGLGAALLGWGLHELLKPKDEDEKKKQERRQF